MKKELFTLMLERVYSTFGQSMPTGGKLTAIWLRAQDIPDEAAPTIANALCDEDRLPGNMGKALYVGWLEWMQRNPAKIIYESGCRNCDAGWLHAWSQGPGWPDGKLMHWVAPCAECRPSANGARTRVELNRPGTMLMPAHYPGGELAFDRDNAFGVLYVLQNANSAFSGQRPKIVDMRSDKRRFSSLTENELADVAGGF